MTRRVLGLDTFCHDGAACLVEDGAIRVAISEERLTRKKHCRGFSKTVPYCLDAARIDIGDIDLLCVTHPYLSDDAGRRMYERFTVAGRQFELGKDLAFVDHYTCHASSAYYTSGFDESLVFVIDGHGSDGTELVTQGFYVANPDGMSLVYSRPNRLGALDVGFAFESFTYHLGFENEEFDAGKTMGLSAYGEYLPGARERLYVIYGDHVCVNPHYIRYNDVVRGTTRKVRNVGPRREPGHPINDQHCNAAAFLQEESERVLVERVQRMLRGRQARHLCLAGGVAMNGLIANRLREELDLEAVFVPPMPNDAGTAVGAALWAHAVLANAPHEPRDQIVTSAWGRAYDDDALPEQVIVDSGLECRRDLEEFELLGVATEALMKGAVIGWFQGPAEFGPRALGHRSILCDPRVVVMKDHVNARIKKREPFRPFAPAVLAEHAEHYFVFEGPSRFMCFVAPVTPLARDEIPAVVHHDGTARLQTVHQETDERFWRLLTRFFEASGVPVLLNTSFNLAGEPIVETPLDAIDTFMRSGMDLLVIENHVIARRGGPFVGVAP